MPEILNIPDEYAIAIGMVAVRWNHLEQIVNIFLIYLMGKEIFDNRSHIVVAHMAFPQKMDVLGALVEEVVKIPKYASLKKYKPVVEPLLRQAQKNRNSVIHSLWGMKDGKVRKASISARGSLKFSWKEVTLKEIHDASQSIEDARKNLSDLAEKEWLAAIQTRKEDKN